MEDMHDLTYPSMVLLLHRPGMATGLAIMGFGGGALIGGPMNVKLLQVSEYLLLHGSSR